MNKRWLRVLLTLLAVLLASTVTAFATDGNASDGWYDDLDLSGQIDSTDDAVFEPPVQVFTDVAQGDWYYDDVMALYSAGVVNGYADNSFRPADRVTTGEALKMVLLAAGYSTPEAVASHWARGYLNLALDEALIARGEITDLDIGITRQLVAKVAANALLLTRESEQSVFVDTNDDYIQALYEAGIVNGYADNTYRPRQTLERAELAAIVHRIYNYVNARYNDVTSSTDITLHTTEAGISFIKSAEGFAEKPAWDYQQYSVGYGSKCNKDDYPNGITREEADLLLRQHIAKIEVELNAYEEKNNLRFSGNQYDALVSFTYNTGSSWMRSSRMNTYIKSGVYTDNELASAMGIWCHVGTKNEIYTGLISRRIQELKIFLYNDYSATDSGFCYVIFETDKGELEADVAVYRSGSPLDPYFTASANGEIFDCWAADNGQYYRQGSIVSSNLKLHAVWQTAGAAWSGGATDSGVSSDPTGGSATGGDTTPTDPTGGDTWSNENPWDGTTTDGDSESWDEEAWREGWN